MQFPQLECCSAIQYLFYCLVRNAYKGRTCGRFAFLVAVFRDANGTFAFNLAVFASLVGLGCGDAVFHAHARNFFVVYRLRDAETVAVFAIDVHDCSLFEETQFEKSGIDQVSNFIHDVLKFAVLGQLLTRFFHKFLNALHIFYGVCG